MSVASSSSWTSFIKSLASYNGDLSSLTAPPFILSPTSIVEYSQYWSEHTDLLLEPNFITSTTDQYDNVSDPVELKRILAVTKWFISTLRSQYCSRNESMGSEKKPLNPFLGELFVGKWLDESSDKKLGDTVLLSEQVSHHPPITAYSIDNVKNETVLQGYNQIKASMSATSLNVKQFGHALVNFKKIDENYLITLPSLHIEGMLVASPFVELDSKSIIQSSNGYITIIEYSGRGYFSGKKNTFKARIFKDLEASSDKANALYTISGQWSGVSRILKGPTASTSSKDPLFFDAMNSNPQHLTVKPIEEQNPLESRKAWLKVAEAVKLGNYDLIHTEKSKIENDQRDLRKNELENETTWERRWFDLIDLSKINGDELDLSKLSLEDSKKLDAADVIFIKLAKLANLSIKNLPSGTLASSEPKDDTTPALHWRFDQQKFEKESEIIF